MKFLILTLTFLESLGSYQAGYQTNAASSPYQAQFHQNSVRQWAQKVGGYPQPQRQSFGALMPAVPGSPQVFIDTMGSEVETEWERCVESLIKSPDQMAQLDQMGDPHSLEKLLKEDHSTTYTYGFKDGSTVVFVEKSGFSPELVSVDFGTSNMVQPAFGRIPQDPNFGAKPMKPGYQPHSAVSMNPSYFQNCAACVTNNFVWAGGNCMEDCNMIADASCWKHLKGCDTEQKQQKEIQSCQLANDCNTCVNVGDSCVWDHTSCFSTIPLYFQPHDVISRQRDCPVPMQQPQSPPIQQLQPIQLQPQFSPMQPAQPLPVQPMAPMQPVQPASIASAVQLPGGWTSGMNQQNMESKWNEVLAKNSNSALISMTDLQALDEPISVETQVVAGVNYKFKFQDGTEVIVLEQIWMNILTITNIRPPRAGTTLRTTHKQTYLVKKKDFSEFSLVLTVIGGLFAGVLLALSREMCINKESKDVYIDLSLDDQHRKV